MFLAFPAAPEYRMKPPWSRRRSCSAPGDTPRHFPFMKSSAQTHPGTIPPFSSAWRKQRSWPVSPKGTAATGTVQGPPFSSCPPDPAKRFPSIGHLWRRLGWEWPGTMIHFRPMQPLEGQVEIAPGLNQVFEEEWLLREPTLHSTFPPLPMYPTPSPAHPWQTACWRHPPKGT